MMKPFLKLKNPFLVISRSKTKSSKGRIETGALDRLEYENNLLFGAPLKSKRRKSSKNVRMVAEEGAEECIYYDLSSQQVPSARDAPIKKPVIEVNPIQPFNNVEPLITANANSLPEKSNNRDELLKTTINGSGLLFPLFNDTKKEYVPSQIYHINPIMKKSSHAFPTVTTILTETMTERSKSFLNQWKTTQVDELGQDKFDEQQKKQLQSRNDLMKLIKKRLLGARNEDLDIAPEIQGCWQSLDGVFPLFSNLKAMGNMVVHPKLKYKGMIDSIVEFKNKPVLVSWKKSSKIKLSINSTFDAPVQIAAYIGAINYDENYPFRVEECLLVMSYEDGSKADIFHLKKKNCLHYWKMWLERLEMYQSLLEKSESNAGKIQTPETSKNDISPIENTMSSPSTSFNTSTNLIKKSESDGEKIQTPKKSKTDTPPKENPVSPPSTGFNTSAYTTFTEIPPKKSNELEMTFPAFPIYNVSKTEYVSGHSYEMNPVKQEIYGYYPSVTTILSETKSKAAKFVLERWKNNLIAQMGQEDLLETGTLLHSLIQQRLMGTAEKDLDIKPELEGCWRSIREVFPLFSDIKVTESYVVHEELKYKGIIDCIAEFRGKPILIDWKKSDKVKTSIEQAYDAPLQIAAYIGAANYDSLYPFKIEEGFLIYSYIDGTKADIFHLNKENCLRYWNLWQQRLNQYQKVAKANDLRIEY